MGRDPATSTMDDMHQATVQDTDNTGKVPPPPPTSLLYETALEAAEYLRSLDVTVAFENAFALEPETFDEPRKLINPTEDGVTPWDDLPNLSIPEAVSATEYLDVSDKSLFFLQDVCRKCSDAEVSGFTDQIKAGLEAVNIRRFKLELPIVRTDNEIDLREYNRTIWAAQELDLSSHNLPLEPCDQEKDEGLGFPNHSYETAGNVVKSVEDEKIEITKDSFQVLMGYLKSDWTDEDQEAMLKGHVEYQGLALREPLTPPMSPRVRVQEPFIPDDKICDVPISSDPNSGTSEDLKKAEDQIFKDDDELWMSMSEIEELMNVNDAEASGLVPFEHQGLKMDDLKVEEPLLMPAKDDQTRVSPDLAGVRDSIMAIHQGTKESPMPAPDGSPRNEADEALEESLKASAAKLMMAIEQEKLEPLDATVRIAVPVLDFQIPAADWEKFGGNASEVCKHVRETSDASYHGSKWTRKLIEESKMVWKFWTAEDPKLSVEDPIEDIELLSKFLDVADDEDVPTAADFVWKKPGLRILDQEGDDDEDLQPSCGARKPPPADWTTLLKKRKMPDDEDSAKKNATSHGNSRHDKPCGSDGPIDMTGSILAPDEEGGANKLLDNYLELHAPKKRKLETSKFFHKAEAPVPMKPPPRPARQGKDPVQAIPQKLMPCPEIPLSDKPPKLIIAVTVHRNMVSQLERLLPGVRLIDRDYNAHNASIWLPGSIRRSEVTSPIADEADLIVSPSTGIILTTMLKVRQKPLPGAKGNSLLCTRIENINAKYERLVVFVSEDNNINENMSDLSATDAAALARFQGFAATLPSETTVLYVGGGPVTLAKWVAAIAARHAAGAITSQEHLVQDETHWELFLRRAGFNVYAAQVVLGMLRGPDEEPVIDHKRAYGLPAFVKMPEAKRIEMFEGILGGRRVLSRVGRILDANWGDVQGRT